MWGNWGPLPLCCPRHLILFLKRGGTDFLHSVDKDGKVRQGVLWGCHGCGGGVFCVLYVSSVSYLCSAQLQSAVDLAQDREDGDMVTL